MPNITTNHAITYTNLIVFYFNLFLFSFRVKFSSDTSEQHTYSSSKQVVNTFTWKKKKTYARKLQLKIFVPQARIELTTSEF